MVERASAHNLKRTWVNNGQPRDWRALSACDQQELLRQATQVKNIWVPYGI
jgi:aldehyde dehydrogenase (NAD+)